MFPPVSRPTPSIDSLAQHSLILLALTLGAWAIASLPLQAVIAVTALAAAAIALLRWPWLVWPALALALPVTSGVRLGLYTATELILLTAVSLWLMDGARRARLRVYSSPVFIPLLIYIGVLSFSLLRAPSLGDGVAEVVKWTELALVLALLPAMVTSRNVIWMGAALVAAGAMQALWGLYQFAFQIGPEWFVLFGRFMRASGSFRQPNPYAGYLGVILPVAFSLAIWAWLDLVPGAKDRIPALAWALFYTAAFIVIAGGLLASWSRGGWIAAAAALLAVIAVRSRRGLMVAAGVGATAVVAMLLGALTPSILPSALAVRLQGVTEMFRVNAALSQPVTDENFALLERLAHWVAAYRMWELSPWLGIGAGNYATVYESVRLPLWVDPLGHAHNLYLNILAETGLIGLAAFALMWISFAVWTWRRRAGTQDLPVAGWCAAMAAGVLGAMTHLTVHSVVDVLFVQGIYLEIGLLFATLAAACTPNLNSTAAPFEERQK